jgi:hypothetical protein
MKSGGTAPHPEERRLRRVSKDGAASWFETRKDALLTMRIEIMLGRVLIKREMSAFGAKADMRRSPRSFAF